MLCRGFIDQAGKALKSERVALGAKAGDDTGRHGRDVGVVPERLAFVDVGDMHLDDREFAGVQRVENGDRRVREGGRIEDDEGDMRGGRLVDARDQLRLGVALEGRQMMTGLGRRR